MSFYVRIILNIYEKRRIIKNYVEELILIVNLSIEGDEYTFIMSDE